MEPVIDDIAVNLSSANGVENSFAAALVRKTGFNVAEAMVSLVDKVSLGSYFSLICSNLLES